MTDCTQTRDRIPRVLAVLLLVLAVTAWLAASGWFTGMARADGDPASDVLATQTLYLPTDAGVSADRQAQIGALLQAAQHDGYPIRVAVIGTATDLGSLTELWRQPENYARFLAIELKYIYRGTLLVVMPDGYGVAGVGRSLGNGPSALAGMRAPGQDPALATPTAIQRLAAASGHELALPKVTAPSTPGSADTVSWIVFAIGAGLIAVAWTASLRARPLRGPGKEPAAR